MIMKRLIFTIWILVLAVVINLNRAEGQWEQLNLTGAYFISAGNILYAGTNSGVFVSTNNGNNWIAKNNGLNNLNLLDLTISGANLIAATGSGVYVSTNQGNNWNFKSSLLLRHFAVNGSYILASMYPDEYSLYRSTNFGSSWDELYDVFFTDEFGWPDGISSIVSIDSIFYMGSFNSGLVKSSNNGTSWVGGGSGIPFIHNVGFPTIVGFTKIDSTIFVGVYGHASGVYSRKITEGTWTNVNNNLFNTYVHTIKSENHRLIVGTSDGVHMTTNNGLFWINKSQGLPQGSYMWGIHVSNNHIYINSIHQNYSLSLRRNLTEMSSYQPNDVGTICISSPQDRSTQYVDCDTGLFVYPKTTVTNFGSNNQTTPFEVFFEIKFENNVVFLNSVIDTISSGLTHDVSFDPYYILENAEGKYNLKTWTKLLSDDNKLNDTTTAFINVYNPNYSVILSQFSAGYRFANSSPGAACAPSQPIFYWEDTTGSTALIVNGVPQIDLSEGDLDNGYFVIQNIFQTDEQFGFFGEYKNYFKISTNGIIGMGSIAVGISSPYPNTIPSYNTIVGPAFFPFWCDLDFSDQDISGRNLKYKKVNNRLIITYDKAPIKNGSFDPEDFISFQVILESKSSENGRLTIQFDNNRSGSTFLNNYFTNNLAPHTVGIQNWMGYNGIQYRFRSNDGQIITPGPLFSSPLAVSFGPDEFVLPVELLSFTSLVYESSVNLNWQTNREVNNSGFNIERSSIQDIWSNVGFVIGAGNSGGPIDYSFTDKNLFPGKYKYRLKQIDFNGNFEYFNLESEVNIGIPDKYELSQNYPNPFNLSTKINYNLSSNGKVSIFLYDLSGREVATLVNEVKSAGYYNVNFSASNLSSGVYFYKLTAGDYTAVRRMVLLK